MKLPLAAIAAWSLLPGFAPLHANIPGGGTGTGADITLTGTASTSTTSTMSNGIISMVITKSNAQIAPINYTFNNNGTNQTINVVAGNPNTGKLYWDRGGFGGSTYAYSVIVDPAVGDANHAAGDYAEIALLSTSATAGEVEVHYSMRRGSPGFYVSAVFRHRAQDAALEMGEMRNNIYCGSIFNWMHADATKNKLFQTSGTSVMPPTAPKECTLWLDGMYQGQYEDKYKYGVELGSLRAWGWSSAGTGKKNIGLWNVNASAEYYNGGPLKQELTCHLGTTLLNYFNGGHWSGDLDASFATGEEWRKVYGPYFVYCNNVPSTITDPVQASQALYNDALAQSDAEKTAWPYSWFNHPDYPAASSRGTVTGKLVINDPCNPNASGGNSWVGVVRQPVTTTGAYNFENWIKPYQFWVRTGADGNFVIPNVMAGTNYTLFAFGHGAAGTFMSQPLSGGTPDILSDIPAEPFNVTVTAGATTALGDVTWTTARVGPTVFEIGYPDRTARKFKHGEDYWVGDIGPSPTSPSPVWTKFLEYPFDFPSGLTYAVGANRWTTDWNFVQPVVQDAAGNWNGSTSTITFNLAVAPASGQASLYFGQASNFAGNMIVSINGTNLGSAANTTSVPTPNSATGYCNTSVSVQSTVREGIHGAFSDERITFPATLLRAGSNTFTLNMRKGGYFGNHAMYDYLRLELAGYVPPAPANVSAFPGNNRTLVSWPAAPGATSYDILRSTTSGSGYASVATGVTGPICGSGLTPNYVDTTALNGTTYYYVVRSVNPVNASANSPQSAGVTPSASAATIAPSAPTGLAVTAGNRSATLNWAAPGGADLYTIKRSTLFANGGGTYNNLGTVTLADNFTGTSYTDTSPTNGSIYSYTVSAANSAGSSSESTAPNVTPVAPVPTAGPASLTATALQNSESGSITLNWSAVSGAGGYVVQRATADTGPFALLHSVSTLTTTDAGLASNTTYYYRVGTMNSGGTSPFVSASATTPPAAPTNFVATAGASSVTLSWTESAGATNYIIGRSQVAGGPYATIASGVSGTSFTNSPVNNGTTYYYVVAAVGAGGTGINSIEASATLVGITSLTWTGATSTAWDTSTANWLNGSTVTTYTDPANVTFDDTATTTTVVASSTVGPNAVIFDHSANTYTVTATGLSGAASLSKLGTGKLNLTGAATYTGGTTIAAGSIALGSNVTANGQHGLGTGTVTLQGGTLTMNGYTGSNGLPGYGTLANPLAIPAGSSGTFQTSQRGAFTGEVTGGGTLVLQVHYVRGDLGGDWSAFTGQINVLRTRTGTNVDTFRINSNTGFGTAAINLGPYVQACNIFGGTNSFTIGELSGGADAQLSGISISSPGNNTSTYVVGGRDTDATFAGSIVNGTSPSMTAIIKEGIGTWTLSGASTYTGATTINAGTLNLSGVLSGGSPVTVNHGATLAGTGTCSGSVSVASEGVIAPGNAGAGTLTINGALTLGDGSMLNMELSGTANSDLIASGAVSASGTTTVNLTALGDFTGSGTYPLVTSTSTLSAENFAIGTTLPGYNCMLSASGGTLSLVVSAPPPAPTGLTATAGITQIALNWTAVNGANSYNIKRSTSSGGAYDNVASGVTATSFNNTGLASGTTYFYVVSAVSIGGEGANSIEASASVASAPISAAEIAAPTFEIVNVNSVVLTTATSVLGHLYQLQSCTDLTSGNWINVGDPMPGTGFALQFETPYEQGESRCFFRIFISR